MTSLTIDTRQLIQNNIMMRNEHLSTFDELNVYFLNHLFYSKPIKLPQNRFIMKNEYLLSNITKLYD